MREAIGRAPTWLRVLIPTVLIAVWFGISGVGGPYFGKIEEVSSTELTSFLPETAEATKVNERLGDFSDDSTLPAIIVVTKDGKSITSKDSKAIENAASKLDGMKGIGSDISPVIVADDKKAALVTVPIDSEEPIDETVEMVRVKLDDSKLGTLEYSVTGPAGYTADLTKAFAGIDGILLLVALAVVFVILLIVYRSILLPGIVLMSSIFALSGAILVVWWLAKWGIIELNGQVQGILFILVIGAATDYALLYVSRYREALYHHSSKWLATHDALKAAAEPIAASGGTVIVGLMCLLLSDLASNKALGPVGAVGIAMAMLASLTFLPTILYALGRASFWPVMPKAGKEALTAHTKKLERGFWHNVGQLVARKPRPVWIVSGLVLLVAAFGLTGLKADGVDQSDLILGKSDARDGQKVLNAHFPDGSGSPALVLTPKDSIDTAVKVLDQDDAIDGVNAIADNSPSGFTPLGKDKAEIIKDIRDGVKKELAATTFPPGFRPDIEEIVQKAYPFKDATIKEVDGKVLLQATLTNAPDSQAAKDTITRLRDKLHAQNNNILVGGTTAAQLDTVNESIRDRAVIIPIILVAITIILMMLLRAIVAPILLLATTVLSFASSLGVAALLFNNVWQFPGVDPSVVLFGFVFLVALGIDYNIFLMTRVREETMKAGTAKGVIKGLVVTGGVITSAGIVLAATFAALGVIPILFLFQLAFIVAFGVLLDTFVVRSLLVPALIRDIGPFVWWPSKLQNKK